MSTVAKRTRLLWHLSPEYRISSRPKDIIKKSNQIDENSTDKSKDEESGKEESRRNHKDYDSAFIDISSDDSDSDDTESEECDISSRTKDRPKQSNQIDENSTDESKDEESGNEESNEILKNAYTRYAESQRTHIVSFIDISADDSEVDKDYQIYCDYVRELENNTKEDLTSSCSESETDHLDDFEFSLPYKRLNPPTKRKQSPMGYTKEKDQTRSFDIKEKNHSVIQKTNTKKVDKKSVYESSDVDAHGKTKAQYMKVDQENSVKYKKSEKRRRVSQKDYGGSVDAILSSIITHEVVHEKECDDDNLPLTFKFDDSEDESWSQKSDESDEEGLFQEMDFIFQCEEIGSYGTPMVKNSEKDDHKDNMGLCKIGEKGHDIYFEEHIGVRCRLCGVVLLESRFVIPKLAKYAPDRSRRSYYIEDQFSSPENPNFQASDLNPPDFCKKTKGTVWELLSTTIRADLYPHQQEGFEFLWENLEGTIDLSRLRKLGSSGGGCIISHAPGTGKTLLTIIFIESYLKKFPTSCPVIVAPASMLLTWEAEFKKWQAGILFLNLNNLDICTKEMTSGGCWPAKNRKNWLRAMKIISWSKGGSVLGLSYNLYEKLAGNSKMDLEKMGTILLDFPKLVVLDEGHTPRNQDSNIWNTLLKLKTKKRVILSGTPFQNNFKELFNTLRLVRPAIAIKIEKEKVFSDMIQPNSRKRSRVRSASEDIESLKAIISPFVHVHTGHILESKLPGLKRSVIFLNPHPVQKPLIENLGNLAKTFEYEHKLALVSLHPSLILRCSLSEKEEKSMNKRQLEKVRFQPDVGVKTRFVMELIRLSVSSREKVLIFSQFIEPLQFLQHQIALVFDWDVGSEVKIIKGEVNQTVRQSIINDFNDPGSKTKVLLASTKCCSEGINLIGASRLIILDVVWNPSVEKQAISRAYRLGQKRVVYTYHLMAAGTTEEEKYDRQVEKERLAEMVFSSTSMAEGELKKVNVDDKILQQMVDHKELKDMFKEIRYRENQTRI